VIPFGRGTIGAIFTPTDGSYQGSWPVCWLRIRCIGGYLPVYGLAS